jgi:N-acetyl-anhydromuramyl-L-alanine amidase AmpD
MTAPYAASWPFVRARWYSPTPKGTRRAVRLVVIHAMDAPEKGTTAESVAKYFQTLPESEGKKSAHICVDNNSVVQCVWDNDVAYAAPGANHDGIQIELAGYTAQSAGEWMDEYSMATLQEGARAVAYYLRKYELPAVQLTNEQLRAGERGIVGHYQVTAVYPTLGHGHTDPGPHFPWAEFMGMVRIAAGRPA